MKRLQFRVDFISVQIVLGSFKFLSQFSVYEYTVLFARIFEPNLFICMKK